MHGHPVGDDVLREFAAVLARHVREIDIAGRWGGEEFLLLLPGTDEEGARAARRARARRARRARRSSARTGAVRVTASFGVAASAGETTAEQLVAAADAALYRAKRAGKNRVEPAARPRLVLSYGKSRPATSRTRLSMPRGRPRTSPRGGH